MKNVYKSEQRLCPIKCGNWRLGELYVCDVAHAGARVSNRVRSPPSSPSSPCGALRDSCRCVNWASGKWTKFAYISFCFGQDTCLLVWWKIAGISWMLLVQQEKRTGCRAAYLYIYINTYIIYAWRIGNGMSAECHRIARFGSICERGCCVLKYPNVGCVYVCMSVCVCVDSRA